MTFLEEVTNMTQCEWKLSGEPEPVIQSTCDCIISLRNQKREKTAIQNFNEEKNRGAFGFEFRKEKGRKLFNIFKEELKKYHEEYLLEINKRRLDTVDNINTPCETGIFRDREKDCFDLNPQRCYAQFNDDSDCTFGFIGTEQAKCRKTHNEVLESMKNFARKKDGFKNSELKKEFCKLGSALPVCRREFKNKIIFEIAHELLPVDGSFGTIKQMNHPFGEELESLGNPDSGEKACDSDYAKIINYDKFIEDLYTEPINSPDLSVPDFSLNCCNNIANLGIATNVVLQQNITSCGDNTDDSGDSVDLTQNITRINSNPIVNSVLEFPKIATLSAGSILGLVFGVIFSQLFNSIGIGLLLGFGFALTSGVFIYIHLKKFLTNKENNVLKEIERLLINQINAKAAYDQKIATIEKEPPTNFCDNFCGKNSIKKELGGNFKIKDTDDGSKGCICVCKDGFTKFGSGPLQKCAVPEPEPAPAQTPTKCGDSPVITCENEPNGRTIQMVSGTAGRDQGSCCRKPNPIDRFLNGE